MKIVRLCADQLAALSTNLVPVETVCAEIDWVAAEVTPVWVFEWQTPVGTTYLDKMWKPIDVSWGITLLPDCKCCGTGDCDEETENPCLTGTGKSVVWRVKFDVDPSSFSQATMEGSEIVINYKGWDCWEGGEIKIPITWDLTVWEGDDWKPFITNFIEAFNSIWGNYGVVSSGLDAEDKNSILCITVPTGIGNVSVTILTTWGKNWTNTYDDAAGTRSVVDDEWDTQTGSAAQC